MKRENLRNIAIIAHVDHGKTTLVDALLKQSGVFRDNQNVAERIMDSNDIERERGITILAKNTSVHYGGCKINIIDTPGHADFGGEVERVLDMVEGVLLLVDAFEGPMPQTRFVLAKALELGHKVIVVINKIDRPDARLEEVENEVLELLIDLEATNEQLDSPVIFCSARAGTAAISPYVESTDMEPLFKAVLEYIPAPEADAEAPLQALVSCIDYSEYIGRVSVCRISRGRIALGQEVYVCNYHDSATGYKAKVASLAQFEGLGKEPVNEAYAGDIVSFSGIENIGIGDTVCSVDGAEPIAFAKISEPTVEMTFSVNDSPFGGTEGKFVTSRHLRERLYRELLRDVSLRVTDTETTEAFRVCGRGEMHLSILIENMRREGYEMQVGPPRVLYKEIDGVNCEPVEEVVLDLPSEAVGAVIEKLGRRKGEMVSMNPVGERMKLVFKIPSRGLFGYRSEFLTDTKGEGIMSSVLGGYEPVKGLIPRRGSGSLIAWEAGDAVAYGLYNAQERGALFIDPGTAVYAGMIVGESPKPDDLTVNVCKKKHVTNMRASGSDDALRLIPPRRMSLEEALEFIADDELVEITPKSIRLRKALLDHSDRMRAFKKARDE